VRTLSSLAFLLFAACGSGTSSAPATTPDPEPTVSTPAPDAAAAEPVAQAPDAAPEPAPPDPAQVKAELLAAERAAFEKAKPTFDTYCSGCHEQGKRGAKKKTLEHFDMTSYPFGGHHADKITASIREVLAIGGGKPTMPKGKPGSVPADELALIAAWAEAFDASHAGGAHDGMPSHDGHGTHKH
jgi:uncharacterized membrane protein